MNKLQQKYLAEILTAEQLKKFESLRGSKSTRPLAELQPLELVSRLNSLRSNKSKKNTASMVAKAKGDIELADSLAQEVKAIEALIAEVITIIGGSKND